jgi:hypothetical protein
MNKNKNSKKILSNKEAVMGLPLRLTVCLVIGSASLLFILSFILNPCIFPEKIIVDVDPMINVIPSGQNKETFLIEIKVSNNKGYPIAGASVIIKGLGDISDNKTNHKGLTKISITPKLSVDVYEGYLDLTIKAPCKETFSESKMIKIVRGV